MLVNIRKNKTLFLNKKLDFIKVIKRFYPNVPKPNSGKQSSEMSKQIGTKVKTNDSSKKELPDMVENSSLPSDQMIKFYEPNKVALIPYLPKQTALVPYVAKPTPITFAKSETVVERFQKARPNFSNAEQTLNNLNKPLILSAIIDPIFDLMLLFANTLNNEIRINFLPQQDLVKNSFGNTLSLEKNLNIIINEPELTKLITEKKITENIIAWTKEKEKLLNELTSFFNKNYKISDDIIISPNRNKIEFQLLYPRKHTTLEWEDNICNLLQQEEYNNPRIPSYCEHNINLKKNYIEILKQYGNELYYRDQPVWHELIRRAGITTNVDASPTRQEVIDDNNLSTMYSTHLELAIKEGQGPKVIAEAYEIMNKNPEKYYQPGPENFDEKEMMEILDKIMHEDTIIGTIFRKDLDYAPYLSGDDLHLLGVVEYGKGYLAFTTLTSSNDGKTIKFGDKQYANTNVHERDKGEYFRPYTFLVYIPKSQDIFVKANQHMKLVNESKYNNFSVREILINSIRNTYPVWSKNFVRTPITFTPENITKLAIEMCHSRLSRLEKYNSELLQKLDWNNLSEEEKEKTINKRNKSHENNLLLKRESEYRKDLPEEIKKLFDYKKILEKEKILYDEMFQKKKEKENKKNFRNRKP